MQIWDLFAGYEKAHGRYDVKRENEKGKKEGRAVTYKEPVSQRAWDEHLAGTGPGVGIIPLRADDTVVWGCIDIDVIGINHKDLERQVKAMELPLVVCRSKSGGAHCFLFTIEPVDAALVIDALSGWSASLGHGGCEVFPKQSRRYDDERDIGNWLNMPYYHADATLRYGVIDGEPVDLPTFLEYAESMRVDKETIESKSKPVRSNGEDLNTGLFEEGPPCLQILHSQGGFPDGTRNDGMYNVAVYLRKRFPDDWADKMQEYNVAMCDPPLTLPEINTIAKSGGKKDYEFRCRKPPIASHCHRRMCMGRKCGVGEGAEGGNRPEIMDVKRVIGDPTLWFMTVSGVRMMFTSDELINQQTFKKKVADHLGKFVRTIPQDRWDRYLAEVTQGHEEEYAPIDATPKGQFQVVFESYILGQARTVSKEQLITSNMPYAAGDGTIWFRLRGLIRHLDNQGFKYKSEAHVSNLLKEEPINALAKQVSIKGKPTNIWIVAEPTIELETEPPVKFGTTEF